MYATQICILTKNSYKQYICDVCYKYIDASQKKLLKCQEYCRFIKKKRISLFCLSFSVCLYFSLSLFFFPYHFSSLLSLLVKHATQICIFTKKIPLKNISVMYATNILMHHKKKTSEIFRSIVDLLKKIQIDRER